MLLSVIKKCSLEEFPFEQWRHPASRFMNQNDARISRCSFRLELHITGRLKCAIERLRCEKAISDFSIGNTYCTFYQGLVS